MSNSKKILIVTESIDVNDSSGTKGRVALIKNLKKEGFNLKVLHYTRRPSCIENVECIAIKEHKSFLYLFSRIRRVFNRFLKVDIFKKSEHLFGFSFEFFNDSKSIAKSIREHGEGCELILTLSKGTSFRTHHAMLSCPELHDKWAAYVHDPYPYSFFPPPYTWRQPGYKQKERFFLRVSEKAKFSIFPSQLLMEWMGQFYPKFLKTGIVIPHQNLELQKNEKVAFPQFFNVDNFNILHAGNLLKQRSPIGLIEGFKLFLGKNPSAKDHSKLILIGKKDYFLKELQIYSNQLVQLCIIDHQNFDEVIHLQNNASINIILESNTEISPFLPGKFPHCVFADKPILILGPEKSEVKRLMGDHYDFAAPTDDSKRIALIIEQIYKNWWQNEGHLKLNRPDLIIYLGSGYLKNKFNMMFHQI